LKFPCFRNFLLPDLLPNFSLEPILPYWYRRSSYFMQGHHRNGDVPVVGHPPPGFTRSAVARVSQRPRPCSWRRIDRSGGWSQRQEASRLNATRHYDSDDVMESNVIRLLDYATFGCDSRQTTWLFWDLQLRWTFRRCLHYVRRLLRTSCRSLLWYDDWRWRVDGLYHYNQCINQSVYYAKAAQ